MLYALVLLLAAGLPMREIDKCPTEPGEHVLKLPCLDPPTTKPQLRCQAGQRFIVGVDKSARACVK